MSSEIEALISQGKSEDGKPAGAAQESADAGSGGELLVVRYRTFDELQSQFDVYGRNDFVAALALPPIDGEYAVILRAPRQFVKEEKRPETTCQISGGPIDGDVVSMRTAEALWGEGLITDPKSGRARMQAGAKKATIGDWQAVIKAVYPQVENPVAEAGYDFLDDRQSDWFDDWGDDNPTKEEVCG